MDAEKMMFTVWKFRGVTVPCETVVAKVTEPMEIEHEYQVVLGRTFAYTKEEALSLVHDR